MDLIPEILGMPWKIGDHFTGGEVLPERMIALKHAKAERLLSNMAIKYDLLQHYVEPPAKVLDVGCGSGYGCSLLKSFGYDAHGVDTDPMVMGYAKKRPGITYFNCKVEDLIKEHASSFDVITCVDMIEHIHEPQQKALMKSLTTLLRPGGTLLVDTPFREESRSVSKHHVWELGHQDFLNLFTSNEFTDIKRFWLVRYFNTYTVCVKSPTVPVFDDTQAEMNDQIIIGVKPMTL